MSATVVVSREGAVAVLRLNRPDRLNALSFELLAAVREGAEAVVRDGARALLITAEGRAFCSGADLQVGSDDADIGHSLETYYNPLIQGLHDLPVPVVTAVNGAAAGAGAGLALAGDFTVAARSAYFLLAFVNIGLTVDAGLSYKLPRLVGRQRAIEMMLLAERIPAEKALAWGLIHKVVDDDALSAEALALAQRLAAGPTRAYALAKRALNHASEATLAESLQMEAVSQREAGRSADFQEGVAAFLAKRSPVFTGA